MLNEITYIIDYLNVLIKEYPLVFHAFVPVGTILTAILGMKNASHIKTQANIQREIESNRFNIELFEKRLMIYNELKEGVQGHEIYKSKDIERHLSRKLVIIENDINCLKKAIFVFNSNDNAILKRTLSVCSTVREAMININSLHQAQIEVHARINDLNDEEFDYENIEYKNNKRVLETKIRGLQQEVNEKIKELKSRIYNITYLQSLKYMESKLLIPTEAFQPKTSFFRRTWNALSRDEKMVMYTILIICALGLWCALLFGVAFKK